MLKKILLLFLLMYYGERSCAQIYSRITFYVVPHEDDWQLYMGNSAWNDMRNFHERGFPFTVDHSKPENGIGVFPNGVKVVIINITGGHPNALPGGCNLPCDNIYPPAYRTPSTYWEANEAAENKSIQFAATRPRSSPRPATDTAAWVIRNFDDGWGPANGLSGKVMHSVDTINGHIITVYSYKNVVSYCLRIDELSILEGVNMITADNSDAYNSYTDLVNTIYKIYDNESNKDVADKTNETVKTFDPDSGKNPGDNRLHYFTGQLALDAANLNHCPIKNYSFSLYQGLNCSNLGANLRNGESEPQVERKAGLYTAYCLGMLQYNARIAWNNPEAGSHNDGNFHEREYCRASMVSGDTSCAGGNSLPDYLSLFPNPASGKISVRYSKNTPPIVNIRIVDVYNKVVYTNQNLSTLQANSTDINTTDFVDGFYFLLLDDGIKPVFNKMFIVQHSGR